MKLRAIILIGTLIISFLILLSIVSGPKCSAQNCWACLDLVSCEKNQCVWREPHVGETKTVLFFAPHPDDLEVYAGGTIAKHVLKGDRVIEAIMTGGEKGTPNPFMMGEAIAEIRTQEARKGAEILGVEKVLFLGFIDMEVSINERTIEKVKEVIKETKPSLIYAPEAYYSYKYHTDHTNTGRAVERALEDSEARVFLYHSLKPNLMVDIQDVYENKADALSQHKSQLFILFWREIYLHLLSILSGEDPATEKFREVKCFLT
jgi:LmbE family N-acetylglucosaminyl deacetylase